MRNAGDDRTSASGPIDRPGSTTDDPTLTLDAEAKDRAATLSRAREQPPASVAGYEILRRVGEGAYGSVWLAREQNTGKQVAIKFYTHRHGLDWPLLSREVEKLAVLATSRNIIGLISVGWDSDPPFYVMEYLKNGSLSNYLSRGVLPVDEAVRMAKSVLHALVHAHGSGILHCDLKPANILLDDEFEPRLCDFGQSRLSNEQYPALGTLFYMAPEQANLQAVPDARWDVYALGALLYHMLAGEPPHRSIEQEDRIRSAATLEERLATYRQILEQGPRPSLHRGHPEVDRLLAEIVDRCLRVDPQKRYPNAQAVLDALEQRDRHRANRKQILLGILGPMALIMAMAGVFWFAMRQTVETARENLINRALESDALSAQLLARSLDRELQNRRSDLERIASEAELREAVEAATASDWNERQKLISFLMLWKDRADRRRERENRKPDVSWFLVDAQGFQRWRDPPDKGILDENYFYRDYFHGLNIELDKHGPREGVLPIREPHVSTAFLSTSTNRYMTALSVPIWDAEKKNVIGVLARTVHLNELLDDYGEVIRGNADDPNDVNRVIALADRREWNLLDHPWMTTENLTSLSEEQRATLKLPFPVVEKLPAPESSVVANPDSLVSTTEPYYSDPVAAFDPQHYQGDWLAAFASVGTSGWTAIVQERRDEAVRPVDRVQASLKEHGLIGLIVSVIVSVVLVPLVLTWVLRGLSQKHGRIGHRRAIDGWPSGAEASARSGDS